jgi:hypothetical protein
MIVAVAIAVFCLNPVDDVARDTVDLIEANHFYDDAGVLVFSQRIFRDWDARANRFQVRAWRLLKFTGQWPTRNWLTGRYEIIWHDGEITRRVEARAYRETWTQHDPEMRERDYLPKEQRRRLYTPRIEAQQGEGS